MRLAFESPDETPALINEADLDSELLERDLEVREINDQIGIIAKSQETIETACEALEKLSGISSVMEKYNAVGVDAASIAAICTESICKKLGYVSSRPLMPSMESFSLENSKAHATEYSLESFGDMAKEVWEAVVAFIKKIGQGIMDLLRYIGNYITKLLRNMGILRKQVEQVYEAKATTDEEVKVDFTQFCEIFNVAKASDLPTKVIEVLTNCLNVSTALHIIHDSLATFYKTAIAANDTVTLIRETTDANLDYKFFKLKTIKDNGDSITVGDFIKGQHLKFAKKEYKIEIIDGDKEAVSDPMLVANKDLDLIKVLDEAEKLADSIETNVKRSEKNKEGFKDLTEIMVKAANKMANKAKTTQENKEAAKVFKNMANTTISVTSNLLQLLTLNLNESLKYVAFCRKEIVKTQQ